MALREKERCLVITFKETTMAMKMEKEAKVSALPGRLIPLPREISAGCGLSWKAPLEARNVLEELMKKQEIEPDGFFELLL